MVTDARALATVHAIHQAGQSLAIASAGPLTWAHVLTVPLAWWKPRGAMAVVACLGAVQCALAWPRTGNHLFLGVVVSVVLALLDETPEEQHLRGESLLALGVTAVGWGGVHKLVHGLWFRGETLAWLAVSRADVGAVMRPLLSDEVSQRLGGLSRSEPGSGPFRLEGLWVVVSNAVWVGELAAVGLWHRRLRRFAPAALLTMVWLVQLIAHEWEFALLLTNMILPPRSKARWLIVAGVLTLALARLGVLGPPWWALHSPEPM